MEQPARRAVKGIVLAAALSGSFAAGRCSVPLQESARGVMEECRVSPDADSSARLIELVAKRAIRRNALLLRHELKAGIDSELKIIYDVSVDQNGNLKMLGSHASCGKAECRGESELPEMIGVLLTKEFSMDRRAGKCLLEIEISVPPLGREEVMPAIKLPGQNGEGIEL
jgi:hypothetical protein